MNARPGGSAARWRVVALLLTIGLMSFALAPAPAALLHERFLGVGGVDHPGTLWFHAQILRFATGSADLVRTTALYWPIGQDLLRNTGDNLVDALLAAPLAVFGTVAGHNLFLLAVLAANGVAAGWVARAEGAAGPGAWLTGLVFAVAPYPLYELVEGRPAQALLVFFLAALHLFPAVVRGTRPAWALGLVLAILGYQYWFYAIFCGMMIAAGACGWIVRPPAGRRRSQVIRSLVGALAVAGLLVCPLVIPLLLDVLGGGTPGMMDPSAPQGLLLHTFQPLLGVVGLIDGERFVATQRALPLALGATTALTLLFGLFRPRGVAAGSGRRFGVELGVELGMGVVALLLSVGPVLIVGTRVVQEPAYVALAVAFAPLRRLWHPSRALAGLVVLASTWLARLPVWVQVLVGVLALGEAHRDGLLPLPTWDAAVPAAYQCLQGRGSGDQGNVGAIVELPWAVSQRHLWYQTVHGRPILGGFHEGAPAFQPPEAVALRAEEPYLAALIAVARGEAPPEPTAELSASAARVGALGFRYVLLQKDELPNGASPAERARRRRVEGGLQRFLGAPLLDDARASLWGPWGDALPCATVPSPDSVLVEIAEPRRVLDLGERTLVR